MREAAKIHVIPSIIYSDRGIQFISKFWKELWDYLGRSLGLVWISSPDTGNRGADECSSWTSSAI